jgi:hypothetical protein
MRVIGWGDAVVVSTSGSASCSPPATQAVALLSVTSMCAWFHVQGRMELGDMDDPMNML